MKGDGLGSDELTGVYRRSSAAKEFSEIPGSGFASFRYLCVQIPVYLRLSAACSVLLAALAVD
ncbi:MAG: hypothetical protein JSU71_03315 [Betaproteobacteria bacterium]|jgi:hypothetical protein|nr:MAG: hypothetical protein JSU71_03315 [Betaproteobacteria bacterium]